MGFADECALKFKENIEEQYSFFNRVNRIFDKLPLAALIDENIFCSHGGIGHTIRSVTEIDKIDRPLRITQ